jgi:hypothetical protein
MRIWLFGRLEPIRFCIVFSPLRAYVADMQVELRASIGRRLGAAAIIAVLLADTSMAATQVQNPPTASPPSTTTLTTAHRPMDRCEFFFRYWSLRGAFAGYAPLWSHGFVQLPVQTSPTLENTLIGGLQLDVDPRSAQVYVDGAYAGLVSDFSGYYKHLEIVAGAHLVTICAPNYDPLTISVAITPGRTTTHRGTLAWGHGR